ncbi:hypothetical protein HU200_019930 [Digitaria exilis]|uniref:Uncharacterized protein n=1 Tax=Digitaria exilis TaxID=1010633 RepID=A0A835F194_9POAL|nr:hypothetical protein HU200_019930 [Digitaria exilis]
MAPATSSMTSSLATVLLLCTAASVFFSVADAKATTADGHLLVTKTCADIKRHDWGWLPDDVCESRLRLDKRSAAAKHPRDLTLIAMSLAQHASTTCSIPAITVTTRPLTLRQCVMDYATVASAIPVCSAMVYGYNNKLQAGAQHQLAPVDYFDCARRLRRGTAECWFRVITTPDVKKVVIKEVYEALYRTELVAAMVEEMLGIVIKDHEPPQWV